MSILTLRAVVLTLGFMAAITIFSGIFGIFKRWLIISLHLCAVCGSTAWCGPAKSKSFLFEYFRELSGSFAGFFRESLREPMLLLGFILIAWQIIWCGAITGLLPVHTWDDLAYHLPLVAGIVQSGHLEAARLSYECNVQYAGTTHFLYAWVALIGRDSYHLSAMHWFLWILLGMTGYGVLRNLGLRRPLSGFLAICSISAPIFIVESLTAYVDISVAAYFAFFVFFAIVWKHSDSKFDVVALASALGFLHGAKPHTILYSALLLLWLILFLGKDRRRVFSRTTVIIILAALCMGSYWMGYRWIRFRNPVYPFNVQVAGITIFPGSTRMDPEGLVKRKLPDLEETLLMRHPGALSKKLIRIAFTWFDLGINLNSRIHAGTGGYGALFAALILSSGIVGLLRHPSFLGMGFCILALALTPLSHVARYTPMLPFILMIPAGLWLSKGGWNWLAPGAALAAMTTMGLWAPGLMNDYGAIFLLGPWKEITSGYPGLGVVFFTIPVVLAIMARIGRTPHWQAGFFLPVLISTLLTAYRFPLPGKIIDFAGYSEDEAMNAAWEMHRLAVGQEEIDVQEARKITQQTEPGQPIVYRGHPFPPVIGLYYDRAMTHRVIWEPDNP